MRDYRDNWLRRGRPGSGHRRRPRALPPEALALAVVLGPEPRGVDGPPVRGVRLPGLLPGHVKRRRLQERQTRPLPPEHQLVADRQRGVGLPVLFAPSVLSRSGGQLGLAAVLFGLAEAVFHAMVPSLRAKARYGPGFLSAFFLHVSIGINYLRAVGSERPSGRGELARAAALTVAFGALGIGASLWLLEERGEPLPLHGAASGTVWQRRLMPPLFTESHRRLFLRRWDAGSRIDRTAKALGVV